MDAIGLLGLFLLALFGQRNGSKPAPSSATATLPPAPSPWPAALPEGLPPFPGAGWEFDEPPPAAVQQRAGQLVAPLWRQGSGSHRTELTAGRWITYRAEIVRSGKKGVVAYRQKGSSTVKRLPAERATAPSSPKPKPTTTSSMTLPMILTSTSPGWPQPAAQAGGRYVDVQAGRWYQWAARVDGPPGLAVEISKGLALGGAVNIAVSTTPPYVVAYQLQAKHSVRVPIGVTVKFASAGGVTLMITFLEGREIEAPTGPVVPVPEPPGVTMASSPAPAPGSTRVPVPGGSIDVRSPLALPVLRRGRGMPPAAPDRDVKLLQQKLGIKDDGRFGPDTEKQVRAFQGTQAINKLGWSQKDVDGIVGPKTWTALFASPWGKA